MKSETKEPSQLVIGLSHREMVDIMQSAGIFCGTDKFARILIDAQRRAIAAQALDRMTANAEAIGLYDAEAAK